MKKKFICTVCGYIHEGPEPPEKCPVCKVPASKFKEITDEEMEYATVHKIGDGKPEGVSDEMIEDLYRHVEYVDFRQCAAYRPPRQLRVRHNELAPAEWWNERS